MVPIVLIATLSVSLIEAFLILPHHMFHALEHESRNRSRFRDWFDTRFARVREKILGPLVDTAVHWRYLTVGLVIMAFLASISMMAGGVLKFRAFPDLDGDVIEARLLLPQGTPLDRTEEVVDRLVEALGRVDAEFTPRQPGERPLIRNILIQYGANADAFESGAHLATVTADLLQAEQRDARVDDVLNLWRDEVGTIPDIVALAFKEPQIGPAGLPIEIRLQGDDLGGVEIGVAGPAGLARPVSRGAGSAGRSAAGQTGDPPGAARGRPGQGAGRGQHRQPAARRLSRPDGGGDPGRRGELRDRRAACGGRPGQPGRSGLFLHHPCPMAARRPLPVVVRAEPGRGFARIQRIEGRRTVTIRGEIDSLVANVNEVITDTSANFLAELQSRYPSVSVALEGQAAEQDETGGSMLRGFAIGLLGIFLLLSFQFRSYIEPVIVMIAIPMAMIGVVWGHLVMGLDLSMPSMMGMASLAGIVVNDSILLVTFVKRNFAGGLPLVDAARQASRDRFRPVLLTSVTTIAGLLPLLFERSLQAQVLVPLVTSIAFGLMASTVLVLIVVPSAYAILHDFGLSTVAREKEPEEGTPVTA